MRQLRILNLVRASGQINGEEYVELNYCGECQECHVHNQTSVSDFPIQFEFVHSECNVQSDEC